MNTFNFLPEGWNEETEELNINKIHNYKENNKIRNLI